MGVEQKRAITAVVLSGLILFGWQYLFAPKIESPLVEKESVLQTNDKVSNFSKVKNKTEKQLRLIEKESFYIKTDKISYQLTNDLTVLDITSSQTNKSFKDIFPTNLNNNLLLKFDEGFRKIIFSIIKVNDSEFIIENLTHKIKGSLKLDERGMLFVSLVSPNSFKYRFELSEVEEELEGGKYRQFAIASDSLDLVQIGNDDKGDKEISWFGLDFNYHLFAVVPTKKTYVYEIKESGSFFLQDLRDTKELNFHFIFAKKEYDHLVNLGDKLELSVDFGFFSILAVPILRGLQFLFTVFPNYGISIIFLTIFIRFLTFPLQYKSFKNMKKMQVIQPELTKIREKFKDNPQKMQAETMALFKKAGTNPLAGCLPMILQMPIFFAFYRVLYSAVELVDAPFYFWITDLSEKDPYYVLPVLMGITMFFHQKLTPTTTMDPTQQKIMMFMPLIFAVFMKDFPAGLTLYIVISTFVAMLQQMLVYKRT